MPDNMTDHNTQPTNTLELLNKFIRQNKKLDFKTFNFLSAKSLETLKWKGIATESQPGVLKQAKAYQRLVRLLDDNNPKVIKALLKKNIHSAVQIASIPRKQFMAEYGKIFKNEPLMQQVYTRAMAIRSQVLIKYMNVMQNGERHAQAVRAIS